MTTALGARWSRMTLAVLGLGLAAGPAHGIEFWDERIQIHGFAETRMSFGYEDFNSKNKIDMYGWLQVLNVEIESEIAPEGWGPFDMIAAFSRIEVKYDCVWNHACGTLPSVDAFGNMPKNLPHRAQTSERLGVAGSQLTFDRRPYWFGDRERLTSGLFADTKAGQRAAKSLVYGSTNAALFGASAGPDGQLGEFQDIRREDFSVAVVNSGPGGGYTQEPIAYNGIITNPATMLAGDDDAGTYMYNRTSHCKVGNWQLKEPNLRGFDNRELLWSIDDCRISPTGFMRHVANPWRDESFGTDPLTGGDRNPVLLALNLDPGTATNPNDGFGFALDDQSDRDNVFNGIPDATALPFRPGSEVNINQKAKNWQSQGLWMPNLKNRLKLQKGDFDGFDQNFSLNELQWNRGASQQQWKELRELYLEFEAFESRLWVRAGKQTIVWGKTELFRNQDQWNPVDIAIGPLASLEESRIALWALRGIWSFYEVGPLEDVRLELVGLFDKFEPTDIGRCGEPFVPRLACNKSYGLWVHSTTGVGTGVAGEERPSDPGDGSDGFEYGARVEFRYDRFSFALTDYYGFTDTPYINLIFQYDRNVDPLTGRPRHTMSTGRCITGAEEACLQRFAPEEPTTFDPVLDGKTRNLVEVHSINQSLFAVICAGTVGVAPSVDASACAFTLFNSQNGPFTDPPAPEIPFAQTISFILAARDAGRIQFNLVNGDTLDQTAGTVIQDELNAAFGTPTMANPNATNTLFPYPNSSPEGSGSPLVPLVYNGDKDFAGAATLNDVPVAGNQRNLLATFLTDEQEALLGCGPFYLTNCNSDGIDLGNAEASVMLQAFPWFEGTKFNPNWNTTDRTLPQPGTVDAVFNAGGVLGTVDAPDSKPGEVETGPAGTRYGDLEGDGKGQKQLVVLPGAHYDPAVGQPDGLQAVIAAAQAAGIPVAQYVLDNVAAYDITKDGSVVGLTGVELAVSGACPAPCFDGIRRHPFTGQVWNSEMAILSWNLLMLTAALGAQNGTLNRATLDRTQPLALGRCSFAQPQFCAFVSGLAAQARNTRSDVRAGGNGRFGRRNFVWASVGDLALRYEKRNIVGLSMDFAEDITKSSWGVEFTWLDNIRVADNDQYDGLSDIDEYNLTLSADRPTFINFLNANRTFFINSQIFMSYLQGHTSNMLRDGPFTALWLVNANTGYFQDRFLVSMAAVYDFTSQSSAFLPSVQYRFTENFSITLGAAALAGKWKGSEKMGINQFSATDDQRTNDTAYREPLISAVRDLDNFFMRLRYTF